MNNDLPQNIRDLIAQVAKKTKLRKAERIDVTRELNSHFQEALASGKSADDVVRAYGDADACAKSLRVAVIAKRSPIDRAFGFTFTWSVRAAGAFVLFYAVVAISMSMDGPRVSFDPVKQYRDSLPVAKSPDQVAWPAYRDALVEMGLGADDPKKQSEGAIAARNAPLPSDKEWATATDWISAHQPQLAALRAASRRPIFGFPVGTPAIDADAALLGKEYQRKSLADAAMDKLDVTELSFVNILLPHLSVMRNATNVLATDIMLAIDQGDGERATRDAEAMMAISIHVQEGRILIGDLIGMAIRANVTNKILMALEWKPNIFTDTQLNRLQAALRSVPPALERIDLTSERLMFEDVVQRLYTDDGHGDGRFAPQWKQLHLFNSLSDFSNSGGGRFNKVFLASLLSKPYAAYAVAGRKDALDHYEAKMEVAMGELNGSLSDALTSQKKRDYEWEVSMNAQESRYILEAFFTPAYSHVGMNFKFDQAVRDAAMAAIAAELYHRANGKWPASAADLTTLCNGEAPKDPWNGKPILMASDANGFRMWSVGSDGVDDQGKLEKSTQVKDSVDWVWLAPRGNLVRWGKN